MNKKEYLPAILQVTRFNRLDVIATSNEAFLNFENNTSANSEWGVL